MGTQSASIIETAVDQPSDLVKSVEEVNKPIQTEQHAGVIKLSEVVDFIKESSQDRWERERKRIGSRASNYYFGRLQLKELEETLAIEFPETYRKKRKQVENIVKSVSTQLSVVYKQKTKRAMSLVDRDEVDQMSEEEKTIEKEQTKLLSTVYERGKVNKVLKEVEKFAKWSKSVLVHVGYSSERSSITMRPYAPHFWDVMVDEEGMIKAVVISNFIDGDQTADEVDARRYWVWTAEKKWMIQGAIESAKVMESDNPLGMIPFVLFHDEEPFESEKPVLMADNLLVNTNLNINLLLSDLVSLAKHQTYGQPWISGIDEEDAPDVSGHEEVWLLRAGRDSGNNPDVGILQPSGDIDGLSKAIERVANGYATTRGLPSNSFSVQRSEAQSGVALKINNAALVESRESEEEKYQCLEQDIFMIAKAWWNLFAETENGHGLPKLRDDMKMSAIFPRNEEIFESPGETQRTMMQEVSMGLLDPRDFLIMGRMKGLRREEAPAYFQQAKEFRDKFGISIGGMGSEIDTETDLDQEDEA